MAGWGKVARTDADLVALVECVRKKFRLGSRAWSTAHHAVVFGSVILSATAAAALEVPEDPATGLATACATAAAALTTLGGVGAFPQRWRANRDAFYEVDCLLLDIGRGLPDEEIRDRLKLIRGAQHVAWGRDASG